MRHGHTLCATQNIGIAYHRFAGPGKDRGMPQNQSLLVNSEKIFDPSDWDAAVWATAQSARAPLLVRHRAHTASQSIVIKRRKSSRRHRPVCCPALSRSTSPPSLSAPRRCRASRVMPARCLLCRRSQPPLFYGGRNSTYRHNSTLLTPSLTKGTKHDEHGDVPYAFR